MNLAAGATVTDLNFGFHKNDLTPPQVSSFVFNRNIKPYQIEVTFNEPMQSDPALTVQSVGGSNIAVNLSYDAATNTAIFRPSSVSSPVLADGNYRAFFNASAARDAAGNSLTGQSEWSFFALSGDLNNDRTVSVADFIILASNFDKTNATYSDGDLNYDGTVTIADFIDLAANLGAALPAPAAPAPQPAAAEAVSLSSATTDLLQSAASRTTKRQRLTPDWRRPQRLHHRRHRH